MDIKNFTLREIKNISLLHLIEKLKERATWTCHPLSYAKAKGPYKCSDNEVATFINKMKEEGYAKLVCSHYTWEKSGGCIGDELYPAVLTVESTSVGKIACADWYDENKEKAISNVYLLSEV